MYSSGAGTMFGMYGGTLAYRHSDPLLFKFHLRYLHQPFNHSSGQRNPAIGGALMPGIEMQYKFSEKTSLYISFDTVPYSPYYSPYTHSYFSGSRDFYDWGW